MLCLGGLGGALCCVSYPLGNAKGIRLGYFLVPKKNVIDSKGRCFRDDCPWAGSAVPAEADPQMSGGPQQL